MIDNSVIIVFFIFFYKFFSIRKSNLINVFFNFIGSYINIIIGNGNILIIFVYFDFYFWISNIIIIFFSLSYYFEFGNGIYIIRY